MTCRLCVIIIFIYFFSIADVDAQNSIISKSVNLTTMSGETIEFDCLELMDLQEFYSQSLFKWFKITENGETIKKLKNSSNILKLTNITNKDEGTYKCILSIKFYNELTHTFSSNYTLSVNDLPKPNTYHGKKENVTLTVGEKASFLCLYYMLYEEGTYIDKYTWFKNGTRFLPEESDKRIWLDRDGQLLHFENVTKEDSGTYECFSSNIFRLDSSVYYLNVPDTKLATDVNILENYVNKILHLNDEIWWICGFSEYKNLNYTWFKNDKLLNKSNAKKNIKFLNNNTELSIKNISYDDSGNYKCVASDGPYTFNVFGILSVVDPPEKLAYSWYITNISVRIGARLDLKCNILPRGYKTWFSWTKNGNSLILDNHTKNMTFENNRKILKISDISPAEYGTYECITESFYHKVYSVYTLKDPDEKKNIEGFELILCLLIFILAVLMITIIMVCYRMCFGRKQVPVMEKKLKISESQFLNGDLDKWNDDLGIEEQSNLLPYDRKWEIPKNNLKLGKQLGSGFFGVVFKADATGINGKMTSTTVAVKMVKPYSDSCHIKALISEMKIMIHIGKHLNIVNVLGACTEDIDNNLMVIIEYCQYGSIRNYIFKQRHRFINQITSSGALLKHITPLKLSKGRNDPNDINLFERSEDNYHHDNFSSMDNALHNEDKAAWSSNYHGDYHNDNIPPLCTHDLICWSFQIARGMEYLSSKKVIHGDLAIRNVLLSDDNIVKICDFGLAKSMHNYDFYKMSNSVSLPVKWMAIESLRDQVLSTRSDVWSFGIVLWELFSLAETPYPDVQSYKELYDLLISGYRMKKPKYSNHQIYNIMYDCWKMDPFSRPTFTQLTRRISDLLQESSTSYYVNLNEEFIKTSPSIGHYENVISPPNCSTASNKNSRLLLENAIQSKMNDEIEMKRIVHNQGMRTNCVQTEKKFTKLYSQSHG